MRVFCFTEPHTQRSASAPNPVSEGLRDPGHWQTCQRGSPSSTLVWFRSKRTEWSRNQRAGMSQIGESFSQTGVAGFESQAIILADYIGRLPGSKRCHEKSATVDSGIWAVSVFHAPARQSENGGGTVKMSFTVKNTRSRDGDEVAQVYCRHVHSGVPLPKPALWGFVRMYQEHGESSKVTMEAPVVRPRCRDTEKEQYVVEPRNCEFLVRVMPELARICPLLLQTTQNSNQ